MQAALREAAEPADVVGDDAARLAAERRVDGDVQSRAILGSARLVIVDPDAVDGLGLVIGPALGRLALDGRRAVALVAGAFADGGHANMGIQRQVGARLGPIHFD